MRTVYGLEKQMKILMQLAIIFIVCLVGEAVADALPLPFPGSVMAMVVMFSLLYVGVVKLERIERVADFLVSNMAFLFIPLGVGIHNSYELIAGQVGRVLLVCAVSTVVTFGAAALAAGAVIRLQNDRGNRHDA